MNIPQITSIDNALKIYYNYSEIGNKEIKSLFGKLSSATVSRLKRAVKDKMNEADIPSYGMHKINTILAFDTWGINVFDLESRWKKINELNLV
ncbi:MAG: hypothetical protein FWE83_11360 [Oscillospiraceae bacterium]|nr:hypothetical protein [Oscillospiraceae bacterium]